MNLAQPAEIGKSRQLDLFASHLPAKPFCTDSLPAGLVIRAKQEAIYKRYIQPNGPTHLYFLVFDLDRATAAYDWEELGCPPPNIIAINPDNGHAHAIYILEIPVRKAPDAVLKPLRYAAAVEYALCEKLQADYGYAGLICKNPLHNYWIVRTLQEAPYTLGWLADYINLNKVDYRKRPADYGLGRNCTVFNSLRLWAYKAIREKWANYGDWYRACLERATSYNTFPAPLSINEVRSTAKSVAKWVWKNFDEKQFSLIQAARGRRGGRKSGQTRKRKARAKQELLFGLDGLPARSVAKITGIPKSTVIRMRSQNRKAAP